jgi:hypothetical protein
MKNTILFIVLLIVVGIAAYFYFRKTDAEKTLTAKTSGSWYDSIFEIF